MIHRILRLSVFLTLIINQAIANDKAFFKASADFIRRIRPLTAIHYEGVPDSSAIHTTSRHYVLYHDTIEGWLLIGDGSGQVWTLDSLNRWVRQDSTEVFGYSFGAQILPGPMKYGGNGLWKSNGLMLTYSWEAHEWEAVQLSREIHSGYTDNTFFDRTDTSLYQLGMNFSNAGIKDLGYSTDSLYKLDISTGIWTVLGRFNKDFHECVRHLARSWASPSGFLFRLSLGHDAILIDLHKMTYRNLKEDVVIRLYSFERTTYLQDRKSFSTDYGIYTMNPHTYELLDSISWKEISDACGPELPILTNNSSFSGSMYFLLVGGMGITAAAVWYRRRRKKSLRASETIDQPVLEVVDPVVPTADTYLLERNNGSWYIAGKPIVGLLSAESRLLETMIEKRRSEQPLTTQQFNDILGISDRSLDSQKKIRSEAIRNINKRFNQAGYAGEAVQRSRQEDDRRAVTYTLASNIRID